MTAFTYASPTDAGAVAALVDTTHVPYAGGTDLLPRVKLGLATPEQLVDLKRSGLPRGIEDAGDHVRIGALATLAEIERSPLVTERFAALAEAAAQAATPQIRNRATLAGNLLQRPRCWYYRDPDIDCWLKGGAECPAREGRNEHHAIFPDSPCAAVHPSDLAACLVALDATVEVTTATSTRTMPIAELYAAPSAERRVETTLGASDLITAIHVPVTGAASTYRKAMARKTWAFALVGVAVAGRVEAGRFGDLRVVLSGVANTPRRAATAEALLAAAPADAATIEAAAQAVVVGAEPLAENAYKVPLLVSLTRDALTALAATG